MNKSVEVIEDGIKVTNGRMTFTCCYKGPISISWAPWLDMRPLRHGGERGSLSVSLLMRPDPLLQVHRESSLYGAVGMGDAKLIERHRAEWAHGREQSVGERMNYKLWGESLFGPTNRGDI